MATAVLVTNFADKIEYSATAAKVLSLAQDVSALEDVVASTTLSGIKEIRDELTAISTVNTGTAETLLSINDVLFDHAMAKDSAAAKIDTLDNRVDLLSAEGIETRQTVADNSAATTLSTQALADDVEAREAAMRADYFKKESVSPLTGAITANVKNYFQIEDDATAVKISNQ